MADAEDLAQSPGPASMFGAVPAGTTELGIDIIKVDRIRKSIARFGARSRGRVLTAAEQRDVRDRPETFAGRWAAKEAVSKVLGLGVRGIGWRDIEVERLPTGEPAGRPPRRGAGRGGARRGGPGGAPSRPPRGRPPGARGGPARPLGFGRRATDAAATAPAAEAGGPLMTDR